MPIAPFAEGTKSSAANQQILSVLAFYVKTKSFLSALASFGGNMRGLIQEHKQVIEKVES